MAKQRLDMAMVSNGIAPSRSRAQSMIRDGIVCINGATATKPNQSVQTADTITLSQNDHPWVSRAGLKLAHAIDMFDLDIHGKTCLDVGASTGGFTHVLISNGATHVYAVDVGTDQLHPTLRDHNQVTDLQQTDARILTEIHIPNPVDIIVCDASFIALQKVLETPLTFAKSGATLIALIKPQFQLDKKSVGRGGIVKDPELHQKSCDDVVAFLTQNNWSINNIIDSPITGGDGNKEFLCHATKA